VSGKALPPPTVAEPAVSGQSPHPASAPEAPIAAAAAEASASGHARQHLPRDPTAAVFIDEILNCIEEPIRLGIGLVIAHWDQQGSLFLNPSGPAKPAAEPSPYTAHFVHRDEKQSLEASEMCRRINFQVTDLQLKDRPYADLPAAWAPFPAAVLSWDMSISLDMSFSSDVRLQLKRPIFGFITKLADLELQDLHVSFRCRVWFNVPFKVIKVAILDKPDVEWELELSMGNFSVPIPDLIEDTLGPEMVEKKLSEITVAKPLTIDIAQKGKVGFLLNLGTEFIKGAEAPAAIPVAAHEAAKAASLTA